MSFKPDKVKRCRKKLMTQQKFSEKLGISVEHYTKIENAYNKPSVSVFLELCRKLKKPAQYFFWDKSVYFSEQKINEFTQYDETKLVAMLNLVQELYDNSLKK